MVRLSSSSKILPDSPSSCIENGNSRIGVDELNVPIILPIVRVVNTESSVLIPSATNSAFPLSLTKVSPSSVKRFLNIRSAPCTANTSPLTVASENPVVP